MIQKGNVNTETKENNKSKLDNYSISQKIAIVNEWIPDPKHRGVYEKRLTQNLTHSELAELFGYSINQIGNIINECNNAIIIHGDETNFFPNRFVVEISEGGYLRIIAPANTTVI